MIREGRGLNEMRPMIFQLTVRRGVLVQRRWEVTELSSVTKWRKSSEFKKTDLWRYTEGCPYPSAEYVCEETIRVRKRNSRKNQV